MSEYQLTEDEQNILYEFRQFAKERDQIPKEHRRPISHPDKYNYPIGVDDNGNFFPVPSEQQSKK